MFFFDLIQSSLVQTEYTLYPQDIKNINIEGIASDSRNVRNGFLFAAIPGYKNNGAAFIQEAAANGAVAILTEADDDLCVSLSTTAYVIQVKDVRKAFALIAKQFFGCVDGNMDLFGVTGTNGKTSVTHYISWAFNSLGIKTGIIGTLGGISPGGNIATERTTPDILGLFEIFSEYSENNIKAVAMEVSSHALELKRVYGLKFRFGIFTNLTEDHLDFHKTMEEYKKAKEKLFLQCECGIINTDDTYGKQIAKALPCRAVTYSLKDPNADYFASDIINFPGKTEFSFAVRGNGKYTVTLKTPGLFSVYNALAAAALCIEYGFAPENVCSAISGMPPVPGRFEAVANHSGINIILDYAHTPDGIKNVLCTAKEFTAGKIISVFGCGGDRDKAKRSEMGKISARMADYTVITSDNPRSENEITIAYEIAKELDDMQCMYNIIINRKKAIEHAIKCAASGDTVIIMGKGHETYQQFGEIKYPFSDRDVIKETILRFKL